MASLIPKNGVLLNYAAVAPSPSKDYCQIIVDLEQVIFRLWKISLRTDAKVNPTEVKDTYEDFLYDDRVQGEVHRVFGKSMLEYVKTLTRGQVDWLPRLPRHLLLALIQRLDLEDISRLSLTSKFFWELCCSDDLWRQIYRDQSESAVSEEMESLAEAIGWQKLFFTNKLQLQMQMRRLAVSRSSMEDDSDDTAYGTPMSDLSPTEPDGHGGQSEPTDGHGGQSEPTDGHRGQSEYATDGHGGQSELITDGHGGQSEPADGHGGQSEYATDGHGGQSEHATEAFMTEHSE